jgi:hypothetical protein
MNQEEDNKYRKVIADPKDTYLRDAGSSALCDDLCKLAVLNHVDDDIKAADELSIHDELREGWPIVHDLES